MVNKSPDLVLLYLQQNVLVKQCTDDSIKTNGPSYSELHNVIKMGYIIRVYGCTIIKPQLLCFISQIKENGNKTQTELVKQ